MAEIDIGAGFHRALEHIIASRNNSLPVADLQDQNIAAFLKPGWGDPARAIANLTRQDIAAFEKAHASEGLYTGDNGIVGPQVLAARLGRLDPQSWQGQGVNQFGTEWYTNHTKTGSQAVPKFLASFDALSKALTGPPPAKIYKADGSEVAAGDVQAFLEAYNADGASPEAKIRAAQNFLKAAGFTHVNATGALDGATAHALMDLGVANHPSLHPAAATPAPAAYEFPPAYSQLLEALKAVNTEPRKNGDVDKLTKQFDEVMKDYFASIKGHTPHSDDIPKLQALYAAMTKAAKAWTEDGQEADKGKAATLTQWATPLGLLLQRQSAAASPPE
jgi:hypothetical protein